MRPTRRDHIKRFDGSVERLTEHKDGSLGHFFRLQRPVVSVSQMHPRSCTKKPTSCLQRMSRGAPRHTPLVDDENGYRQPPAAAQGLECWSRSARCVARS